MKSIALLCSILATGCATTPAEDEHQGYFYSFCLAHQLYIADINDCLAGRPEGNDEKAVQLDIGQPADDCYARLTQGEHMSALHLEFQEKEKEMRAQYKCPKKDPVE